MPPIRNRSELKTKVISAPSVSTVGSAASAASCASPMPGASTIAPAREANAIRFIRPYLSLERLASQRIVIHLASAHPQRAVEIEREDLAIADLVGAGGPGDRLDHLIGHVIGHRDL